MFKELLEMLTYRRPAGGDTERQFINTFIRPVGIHNQDERGNLWTIVGDNPHIMWSSHTDTVHYREGRQFIGYLKDNIVVADNDSNCLGADDTTGVWIMLGMIRAGVPGLYVFHRAEEKGGHGSAFFSANTLRRNPRIAALDLRACIAFDRHSKNHVITHQWGGRCASDAFANSLGACLGAAGLKGYGPNAGGSFTDSANYTDEIGECTNISVGYKDQHRRSEHQSASHAIRLLAAMCQADWANLEFHRQPGEADPEEKVYTRYRANGNTHRWFGRGWAESDYGDLYEPPVTKAQGGKVTSGPADKTAHGKLREEAEKHFAKLSDRAKDKAKPKVRVQAGQEQAKGGTTRQRAKREIFHYSTAERTSPVNPEELDSIAYAVHGADADDMVDIFYGSKRYRRLASGFWYEADDTGGFTIPVTGVLLLPAPPALA